MIDPSISAAVEAVVRRTRHARYRQLVDPDHPDYRPEYVAGILAAAGRLVDPAPGPAPDPEPVPADDPAAPSGADLLANARACPHRGPIPEAEREGCGCARRCSAGRSPRPNGGVTVLDCWACPIAPRHQGSA